MVLTERPLAELIARKWIDAFVDSRFLAVGCRAHEMLFLQIEQASGCTYKILASEFGQGGIFLD